MKIKWLYDHRLTAEKDFLPWEEQSSVSYIRIFLILDSDN